MVIPDSIPAHINAINNEDVSYRSTVYYTDINNIKDGMIVKAPVLSIFDKYRHFLHPIIEVMDLTEENYKKYRFKPKTLSYDLYNTTEFWAALLSINNCTSILEFDLQRVKVYHKTKIRQLLNEIMVLDGLIQ